MSTETSYVNLPAPARVVGAASVGQWSQFSGLYVRELLRTFRNPLVLLVTVAQPFMWLAFFGSSFSGAPAGEVRALFGTNSFIAFLLPGVLSTSMLTIGMFGAMSTIQDKRFGFMKRILLTPTNKGTVFLAKALGSTTRGMVGIPIMVLAAFLFGVRFQGDPLMWAGWVLGLVFLGFGFSCLFLAITASSTDWQTPGVLSNFITMPLMFASGAILPEGNFPLWMQVITRYNPVSFSANLGRGIVVHGTANWFYLGELAIFAGAMALIGTLISRRYMRVE